MGIIFTKKDAKEKNQRVVEIEEPYWKIEEYSYKNNIRIKQVLLGKSVTEIGSSSFYFCTNLNRIRGEAVKKIDRSAFEGCTKLRSVELSDTFEYLGRQAFRGCKRLSEVFIQKGSRCAVIPKECFGECSSLSAVSLPECVSLIEDRGFYKCKALQEVRLPGALKEIGRQAFYLCGLTGLSLPEGLAVIGEEAFASCKSLTYVRIPESVQGIGNGAFRGCDNLKVLEFCGDPRRLGERFVSKNTTVRCKKGGFAAVFCTENEIPVEYGCEEKQNRMENPKKEQKYDLCESSSF